MKIPCTCTQSDYVVVKRHWSDVNSLATKTQKARLLLLVLYGVAGYNADLAAQEETEIGRLFGTEEKAAPKLFGIISEIVDKYPNVADLRTYVHGVAREYPELARLLLGNAPLVFRNFEA